MVSGQGSEQFLDISFKAFAVRWSGAMLMPNLTPTGSTFSILRHRGQLTQTGAESAAQSSLRFGKVNEGIRGNFSRYRMPQRSSTSRPVTRKACVSTTGYTPRKIVRA